MHIKSTLPDKNLHGKSIFLRADLNVPLHNGTILCDLRLTAILPTINYILEKKGKIILATHIGKPHAYDPALSTSHLLPWFKKRGYSIIFTPNFEAVYTAEFAEHEGIILLENLRFFPGEKKEDLTFARRLAEIADLYVNDAFGMLASTDCSVTLLPQLFSPENRCFGLLIEKELRQAAHLLDAEKPFTLFLGGNKSEKIHLLKPLMARIDTLILLPSLLLIFLKAKGEQIDSFDAQPELLAEAKQILSLAQHHQVKVIFPLDFEKYSMPETKKNHTFVTVGPVSLSQYQEIIANSKTILYNGLLGFLDYPASLSAIRAIFTAMAHTTGFSAIGGGDSTAALYALGLEHHIDYVSTGGGSLLAYIAQQKLPALEILLNR